MAKQQFARSILTDGINAVLFIIVLGLFFTAIGSMVGEGFKDINLNSLGQGVASVGENPLLLGVGLLFFLGIGVIVYIFGKYVRPLIGKVTGLDIPEGDIDTSKKAYFVTFLLTGVLTFMIIAGFNSFLQGINPAVNITDLSTLVTAVNSTDPMFWAVFIIGLIGLGAIVGWFGRNINRIREGVPDKIAKI